MKNLNAREESLDRVRIEIQEEKAAALGRISRTLQEYLENLTRLRMEIEREPSPGSIEAYCKVRSQAKLYYWYLIVQREAIGIRNHSLLSQFYPILPALAPPSIHG